MTQSILRRSSVSAVCLAGVLLMLTPGVALDTHEYLYWVTSGNTIGRANVDGTAPDQGFLTGTTGGCGVAVDGSRIYWTGNANGTAGAGTIGRANLDGADPAPNLITGANNACGVAVDDTHIYWSNTSRGGGIGRADLDGSGVDHSFVATLDYACGVAVDGTHLYWTNRNAGAIGRCDLDGNAAGVNQRFIVTGGNDVCGVAVDGAHVYWANFSASGTIGRADLDGSAASVNQSFITGINRPCGVAVDASHVYWASAGDSTIGRANIDGSVPETSFITGANLPCWVAVASTEPPPVADSYFLPSKTTAKVNAKNRAASKLTASGVFDTGSGAVDLTHAAQLTIGSAVVGVSLAPVQGGKSFTYSANGLSFSVTPNKSGSSRAKFKLTRTGDLSGVVPQTGDLTLLFKSDLIDATGVVRLANGTYVQGKVRGSLVEPRLYVRKVTAGLNGAGNDTLSLVLGFAPNGSAPGKAPDFNVKFAGGLGGLTIQAAQFVRHGETYEFDGNVGGITRVLVNYLKETITVKGTGLTLPAFAAGADPLEIVVGLGSVSRTVRVRAVSTATALKY